MHLIGFGDFVPAQGKLIIVIIIFLVLSSSPHKNSLILFHFNNYLGAKENPEISIALCSVYLLFGIALLAMSFNLVQEEVIAKVKSVARRLGIIKDDEEQD